MTFTPLERRALEAFTYLALATWGNGDRHVTRWAAYGRLVELGEAGTIALLDKLTQPEGETDGVQGHLPGLRPGGADGHGDHG